MTLSKDTNGKYVEKERGRVVSGMQYKGARRKGLEVICMAKVMFPFPMAEVWLNVFGMKGTKMKYFFQSLSRTGLPIFSARGIIRNKSCFYKMETPPRIASCPRNPLIKFLSDYLGYSLSLLILTPSRTYFILPSRRRSKQRPMKTSVFVLPTHFITFHQIL